MPIAFDTNEVYRYVISTDRSKPVDEQPTLLFHYPTCSETRHIANTFDASDRAATIDEMLQLEIEAIKTILCGWEHFKDRKGNVVPYDPENVGTILTRNDFLELESRLLGDMNISEMDKKKAALLPQSKLESSAPNVTANA